MIIIPILRYISVYEKFGEQWPINNQKFNNDNSYNKETFKLYKSYLHINSSTNMNIHLGIINILIFQIVKILQ